MLRASHEGGVPWDSDYGASRVSQGPWGPSPPGPSLISPHHWTTIRKGRDGQRPPPSLPAPSSKELKKHLQPPCGQSEAKCRLTGAPLA